MLLRFCGALAALWVPLLACAAPAAAPVARIEGAVHAPSATPITGQARLADLILQARPRGDAYLLGGSFQREQARAQQLRLRAGVAYDLEQLSKAEDAAVRSAAETLSQWLDEHPATGRIPQALSPRLMQAQPQQNPVLEAGDVLTIPTRPQTIHVMGAVGRPCTLPHAPQRDALDYLRDCPATPAADPSDLYVIQPDGRVQLLGIALWNRADPQSVAPGGTLFVPVRASALPSVDSAFNREFAAFIATQPVTP
ncbi:capsule biosynthesis GfcC family protein [Stenotrophomonas sp. 24(2023)]|uniref:capsule biosynthesis GfcC family protein n=1 Tax=Stenotrophomonas sp. 24(2023) TaxID=3068324 RepID=UPI0027E0F7E5|nr:capsule biosynthesis GfcC family protein [Stenotrophomonas sp. 24(2023)]WMJ68976.1 capsule biosynthesis GfcC family protein [Stenotrophomonas sp. 24(2023)]